MSAMKFKFHLIFICLLSLSLAACSSDNQEPLDDRKDASVEEMYIKAQSKLKEGSFVAAAREFDNVEQNYPYSDWAKRAQLMSAYSYYKDMKYVEAVDALERFIQLHPGDKDVDYAYYLKALCFYERISDVGRDQKMTSEALDALRQVASRFPDSKYARDAKLKMDLAVDHIAGKHMEIGRYYLVRKHYNAAIGRFKKVVEQYQTTTHVAEALHRLVESYLSLGLTAEAKKNAAILGANYPETQWYKDSYRLFKALPETKKRQDKVDSDFFKEVFGKLINFKH